jgi:hypothetical protein
MINGLFALKIIRFSKREKMKNGLGMVEKNLIVSAMPHAM